MEPLRNKWNYYFIEATSNHFLFQALFLFLPEIVKPNKNRTVRKNGYREYWYC